MSVNTQESSTKPGWRWVKHPLAKSSFTIGRWLHVYVSSVLLGLVLFFSVTGFTLNHADWFDSRAASGVLESTLPSSLVDVLIQQPHDHRVLLEYLTREYGLETPRTIELDLEAGEISLDYPLPGGFAFVSLSPEEHWLEVEYQSGTLIAWLNDLHKGRHTGKYWLWLIDLSTILMVVLSLSGGFILLQNRKFRHAGVWWVLAGMAAPWLVAWGWVPSLAL